MTQFCEVAVPVPLDKLFFYSVPPSLEIKPGMRVIVPFGTRKLVGVVLRCGVQPADIERKLIKPIQATMDEEPALSNELLRLGAWMAGYYQVPVGEALAALLPRNPAVRKTTKAVLTAKGERALHISLQQKSFSKKASTDELALLNRLARRKGIRQESLRDSAPMLRKLERRGWIGWERTLQARSDPGLQAGTGGEVLPEWGKGHELTRQQREALTRVQQAMETGKFSVLLLQGVTGSGKTEVYLRAMETALRRNRPVLMLVPEINLTPAMAGLFTSRFGSRVALLHSGLGEGERAAQWQRVRAGHSDVVLGTRSAVMAPLDRPGLVIVDEEQDSSYKQDEAPRYNGRDVAILRAREAGATVILGSSRSDLYGVGQVLNVLHAPAQAQVDAHQVDPPSGLISLRFLEVPLAGVQQSADLRRRQGLLRGAVPSGTPGAHLDEHQFLPVLGHDVHLAVAVAVVGCHDSVPFVPEKPAGQRFAPRPQLRAGCGHVRPVPTGWRLP